MGSKNKLKRFKENQTFTNVIQPDREKIIEENLFLKGKWNSKFFKNKAPIILELGCGKGEYSIYLSKKYPKKKTPRYRQAWKCESGFRRNVCQKKRKTIIIGSGNRPNQGVRQKFLYDLGMPEPSRWVPEPGDACFDGFWRHGRGAARRPKSEVVGKCP